MASLPNLAFAKCTCRTQPSTIHLNGPDLTLHVSIFADQLVEPATSLDSAVPSLPNINLADIAVGLDDGSFTVLDLVKAYTKRIDEVDGHFRSILETNPHAEATARSLDEETKTSGRRW